jgi:hypothetical protein
MGQVHRHFQKDAIFDVFFKINKGVVAFVITDIIGVAADAGDLVEALQIIVRPRSGELIQLRLR